MGTHSIPLQKMAYTHKEIHTILSPEGEALVKKNKSPPSSRNYDLMKFMGAHGGENRLCFRTWT